MQGRWRAVLILLCLFLALTAEYSFAQLDSGTIAGVVKDQTGAVVPNASIKITNTKTGISWTAKSGSIGEFSVPALPVGPYQVKVEAKGFKSALVTDIALHAVETARADITLEVGAASEQITVTASMANVNTSTSESGVTVDVYTIQNLPLNGRDFTTLMALAPGTNMTGGFTGNSMDGFPIGMDGLNITLDGTDATRVDQNTQDLQMGRGSARVTRASVDSIQEFKVLSSAYSAEHGRSVGNIVNVITKSGGNTYHGEIFEYFRNDYMDAKNYFSRPEAPAPFRLNQFGGNLAGPIVKNKLFFFTNYEGVRQIVSYPSYGFVLNQAMRDMAVPAVQPIVDAIPKGNGGSAWDSAPDLVTGNIIPWGHWFDIYWGSTWNRVREDTFSFKVDYTPSDKDRFAFRYNLNDSQTTTKFGYAVGQTSLAPSRVQLGKLTWTHNFSPSFLNEAGLAVDRPRTDSYGGGGAFHTVGFSCFFCNVGLGVTPGPALFDIRSPNASVQFIDTATKVAGRHQLRFGADIKRNMVNRQLSAQDTLTFGGGPGWTDPNNPKRTVPAGNGPEGMLLNQGLAWSRIGYPMQGVWNTNFSFFFNDDVRVTPRFTLNLGLRYDYNTIIHDPTGKMVNFDLATLSFTQPGQPLYSPDRNDFAPRIGFAWDPFGNGKTSIRGGYGIFYLPVANNYLLNQAVNTNPNLAINIFDLWFGGVTCTPGVNFTYPVPTAFPNCSPTKINAYTFDKNIRDSYSEHWSFNIQRELAKSTVLEVAYVGNHSLHMPGNADINTIANQATNQRYITNNWSEIYRQGNFTGSVYNAMQTSLRRWVGKGLNVNFNWTWSHEKDDMLGLFEQYQDPRNLAAEWANGDTDVRHVVSGSVIYDIPTIPALPKKLAEGWQVTGFVQSRSGLPVNVLAEQAGWFVIPRRPNCVAGVPTRSPNYSLPGSATNPQLNLAAFAVPAAGQFGDCPRNAARGPDFFQPDFALAKSTKINERVTWQFRGEIFNLINHPNFFNPGATMGQSNWGMSNSTVGNLVGVGTSRQIQLTTKLIF